MGLPDTARLGHAACGRNATITHGTKIIAGPARELRVRPDEWSPAALQAGHPFQSTP
jgi:hypothetical protein